MGVSSFINQSIRILKMAKKPTWKELKQMIKITGLGFVLLGVIGYFFQLIVYLLSLR